MNKKITAILSGFALIASLLVVTTSPSSAAFRLPRAAMTACEDAPLAYYCVESVSIQPINGAPIELKWVKNGSAVPAEVIPADFWAPVATLRAGKVVSNNWWLSQYQRDVFTSGKAEFQDLSALWNTPNHPETGARFDTKTKTWDINKSEDFYGYQMQCYDPKTNQSTDSTYGQCYAGSIGIILENELRMIFNYRTKDEASKMLTELKSQQWIDLADLAERRLRPAIGSTYNTTSKEFSKTEPLVTPPWVIAGALANGWILAGTTIPTTPDVEAVAEGETETVTAPLAPDTLTAVSPLAEAGRKFSGRWTLSDWDRRNLGLYGYDGIFVETRAFNQFSNHFFMDVLPTFTDKDNQVYLAGQVGNKDYSVGLDPDLVVTVKIKAGSKEMQNNLEPAVTVAVGVDVEVDFSESEGWSYLNVTGQPVTVPLHDEVTDCDGEEGVAKANIRQLQTLIIVNTDTTGFGVPGMSGEMYVGSNGVCSLSTPEWDSETKSFEWNVGAPHFAPDGKTVNQGFYKAVIPAKDAELLWGLTNLREARTALQITVTTEAGGSSGATSQVVVKDRKIIIDVTGFEYSRPKLTIKMKPNYKPSKAKSSSKNARKTITCVMGKTTKKVTGTAPKCPPGYKVRG